MWTLDVLAKVAICRCLFVFFSCCLTCLHAQQEENGADAPASLGVTYFGKISVTGGQQNLRGSIASTADRLRVDLNKICGQPKRELKLPLIIELRDQASDRGGAAKQKKQRSIVSAIQEIEGDYQLLIYVNLAKGVDQSKLRYHIMEMLLYERGLGEGQTVEEDERVIVKPWLVLGMLEVVDIKAGKVDKRIYQADVNYLEILPLQKVLQASEKQWRDMIGREPHAFRAISGALASALLRQPKGRPAMSSYLAEFATFKGEPENLLRKHFPGMNKSRTSLQKWINLELLELGTARLTEVYSILETDKRLEDVLKLRYRDDTGAAVTVGIDGYRELLKLEPVDRFEAVAGARAELERLSYRCFPSFRPLINEYELLLRDVIRGEDKEIDARLTRLLDVRMKMKSSAKRVRDYLDWYYITQSNELSGDFDKYRDLNAALEREKLRPPADDAMQKYLDQIQRLFSGGGER